MTENQLSQTLAKACLIHLQRENERAREWFQWCLMVVWCLVTCAWVLAWETGLGLVALLRGVGVISIAMTCVYMLWRILTVTIPQLPRPEHRAAHLMEVGPMHPEHQAEAECLQGLVNGVRRHESSDLVVRLDRMVASYQDRARRLLDAEIRFDQTAKDEPEHPNGTEDSRVCQMRVQARAAIRQRVDRLRQEMTRIGQTVRLVYERSIARDSQDDELSEELAGILDEAESLDEARAEVHAALLS